MRSLFFFWSSSLGVSFKSISQVKIFNYWNLNLLYLDNFVILYSGFGLKVLMLNYYNFWKSGDQKLLKDLCVLSLRDSFDLYGTVNYILFDFIPGVF